MAVLVNAGSMPGGRWSFNPDRKGVAIVTASDYLQYNIDVQSTGWGHVCEHVGMV